MASPLSVTEARANLPALLDRVDAGEEVTITRHGRAVAVLISPGALRARRADEALASAERVRDLLRSGATTALSATEPLTTTVAEALIAEVRAGRAAR